MIEEKLKELGIELPEAAAPVANYVGFVQSGNQIFISGQLPMQEGELKFKGKLGKDFMIDQGAEAAKLCAINVLAQAKAACGGDLNKIKRVVKLGIFVAGDKGFTQHRVVANGASDLMVEVFGDVGKHSRAAVGVDSLPFGCAVEIDAIFEV